MPEPIVDRLVISDAFKPDARERANAALPFVSLYGRREARLAAEDTDWAVVLLSLIFDGDTVLRKENVEVLG